MLLRPTAGGECDAERLSETTRWTWSPGWSVLSPWRPSAPGMEQPGPLTMRRTSGSRVALTRTKRCAGAFTPPGKGVAAHPPTKRRAGHPRTEHELYPYVDPQKGVSGPSRLVSGLPAYRGERQNSPRQTERRTPTLLL
jgi:hypothetical protein